MRFCFDLRTHAFVICFAMIALVGVLGIRAYSIAKVHSEEVRELVEGDAEAQGLILRMESAQAARDVAIKKLKITGTFAYERLAFESGRDLEQMKVSLEQVLQRSYPDLSVVPSSGEVSENSDATNLESLKQELERRRQLRLARARTEAQGLLRLIIVGVLLSGGISLWLLGFLYRSLIRPVAALKEATQKIRSGDLSCRIPQGTAESGAREFRELSASFNAMAEKLEQLDDAKSEFLATISHEFKNPLAALKEGLGLLSGRNEFLSPESRAKTFAACIIASKRLESMMMNLLCHSRMESGLYQFDLSRKDFVSAIYVAMDEIAPVAAKKSMSVSYRGLPKLLGAFNWDGVIQVMENLILNAIKYGREGTEVGVFTEMRTDLDEIPLFEIRVSNVSERGDELAEGDLESLFDRFYRGGNSSQKQGLGLGLHVVKRIVQAHHGNVSVDRLGDRTEFKVHIPIRHEGPVGEMQVQPSLPPQLTLV
jgi:signal transduction histidine kinase